MLRVVKSAMLLVLVIWGNHASLFAQAKFQNAEEAWRVGVAYYNSRNFAASREPFEAALKMAPNDKFRLKVNDALMASYRLLPEPEKMFGACEYVIEHSKQDAKKSIVRRSLISFSFHQGKIDDLIKRHEDRLKKNDKDRTSLYILAEVYSGAKSNPQKAIEYTQRLAKVDGSKGKPVSVRLSASLAQQFIKAGDYQKGAELYEKIAPQDESLAAWHWKEAASAWLKAGEKKKALAAAKKSHESAPEKRSDLLTHFWHKGIADIFLATDDANLAIEHYKKAIKTTKIDGYIQSSKAGLKAAKEKARQ